MALFSVTTIFLNTWIAALNELRNGSTRMASHLHSCCRPAIIRSVLGRMNDKQSLHNYVIGRMKYFSDGELRLFNYSHYPAVIG